MRKSRRNDPYKEKMKEEAEELTVINKNDIIIPKDFIDVKFSRSSGPGGQNVNKLNTKAEIRFNLYNCHWLDKQIALKLKQNNPSKINNSGEFYVVCQETRDQARNLAIAYEKLRDLIYEASQPEKKKQEYIPPETKEERQRRIERKRHKSDIKKMRNK